jgi:hypothetical protein
MSTRRFCTLLAALAMLLLAPLAGLTPARAVAPDVCPSGCTYSQLQPALDAATAGATITIGAGTYTGGITIAKNITLQGEDASSTIIQGGGPVVTINSGVTASIQNVTIAGGANATFGGGILNQGTLTVSNGAISGNGTCQGGLGVKCLGGGGYNTGTLTVRNSTISGNTASNGAGIYNNGGTLTLTNSTVNSNTVPGSGGGIYNTGGAGRLTVSNSTFSGNAGVNGGGIYNYVSAATLTNSTISGNSAPNSGVGGGIFNLQGPVTLSNTIVAGNSATSDPDCLGTLTDGTGGHNLLGNAGGCSGLANGTNGDQVGIAPKLEALADNDGPTQTMALLIGSPAIGAGDAATCESLVGPYGTTDTDQRGGARGSASRGACDIGAYDTGANKAPTANAGPDQTVSEGATVTLDGSGSSDPNGDMLTYTWALVSHTGPAVTLSSTTAVNPAFGTTDNGSYTFSLTVSDGKGGMASDQVVITVTNVAPTATFTAPAAVDEGSAIPLALTSPSDPSPADTAAGFSYAFNCGSGYGAFGASATATCATTDNGTRTVQGEIRDKDGGVSAYTANVDVRNVAPTVGAITAPADPVASGVAINASASFTDPGAADTHTATWNWGDGSASAGTVNETNGSGLVSGSHTYTAAGVYTLTLTVTDDDGGAGTQQYQYVVVYDPSGGFVTGGGWITSPVGACKLSSCTDDTTGKASFGFVAKYQQGANVPTGNTEFQFQAGNLNFTSTAYDWLVVAGAKAQFKGTGTINGGGDYGFLLTATDGAPDCFRIKIWDTATGAVVYDNQLGAADGANPTTALGGGSIQIHK